MTYEEMKNTPVWPMVRKFIKMAFAEDNIKLEDLSFRDSEDGKRVYIIHNGEEVALIELVRNDDTFIDDDDEDNSVDPQLN